MSRQRNYVSACILRRSAVWRVFNYPLDHGSWRQGGIRPFEMPDEILATRACPLAPRWPRSWGTDADLLAWLPASRELPVLRYLCDGSFVWGPWAGPADDLTAQSGSIAEDLYKYPRSPAARTARRSSSSVSAGWPLSHA